MRGLSRVGFLIACAAAAVTPLAPRTEASESSVRFPGWPQTFDGRPLHPRPLAARERRFAAGFPGNIATFGDGRRLYVVRWVTRATRRLHPAADCFRGAGYAIEPRPLLRDDAGRSWSVFAARRGTTTLVVRERIVAESGANDATFTDASSWYWSALFGRSEGPWWAWTLIENEAPTTPASPGP